jgi:hypothetical protein
MNIGMKFGRWTIKKFLYETKHRDKYYLCVCDCGTEKEVNLKSMKRGLSTSCGCRRSEVTTVRSIRHGHSKRINKSSEYRAWCNIRNRCLNHNVKSYKDYGGRGIKVCDAWLNSFENFLKDMGEKPSEKHTIDRIDVNGNYEPSNCRWATTVEQSRNKRNTVLISYDGKSLTLSEWSELTGVKRSTLSMRFYNYNWSAKEVIEGKST